MRARPKSTPHPWLNPIDRTVGGTAGTRAEWPSLPDHAAPGTASTGRRYRVYASSRPPPMSTGPAEHGSLGQAQLPESPSGGRRVDDPRIATVDDHRRGVAEAASGGLAVREQDIVDASVHRGDLRGQIASDAVHVASDAVHVAPDALDHPPDAHQHADSGQHRGDHVEIHHHSILPHLEAWCARAGVSDGPVELRQGPRVKRTSRWYGAGSWRVGWPPSEVRRRLAGEILEPARGRDRDGRPGMRGCAPCLYASSRSSPMSTGPAEHGSLGQAPAVPCRPAERALAEH